MNIFNLIIIAQTEKFVKYFSEKICKAEESSALHQLFPRLENLSLVLLRLVLLLLLRLVLLLLILVILIRHD